MTALTLGSASARLDVRKVLERIANRMLTGPVILMYHRVADVGADPWSIAVSPANFAEHLQVLRRHCEPLPLGKMADLLRERRLPPRAVGLSFDDGYADNLHNALPILEKYDAKATIYMVVDRHERDWSTAKKAHHNTGELAREPKLSDEELQRLVASGRIEIGSHTLTHINMATTFAADKRRELAESRSRLQAQTRQAVASFAYPFGIYGEEDVALAREAGYTTAVTTLDGIDARTPRPDPLQLKRIKVSGKDNLLAFTMRMRGGRRGWKK